MTFLKARNPCWQERCSHVESQRLGQLRCQDTALLGRWAGQRLWLYAVMDSYSSFAFALLHTDSCGGCAPRPQRGCAYLPTRTCASAILTGNGTEFCGTPEHAYELYLALCDIEHRRTKPAWMIGFATTTKNAHTRAIATWAGGPMTLFRLTAHMNLN